MKYDLIDETHDPLCTSWVASANLEDTPFPIQNLPFGALRFHSQEVCGVAIGDSILNLRAVADLGCFQGLPDYIMAACRQPGLNDIMALAPSDSRLLRKEIFRLLCADIDATLRATLESKCLIELAEAQMLLPARINGYTDFLTSRHHTERHGRFKGLKEPLPPAFLSLPVAYHGRTSSLRVSGQDVIRPHGQYKNASGEVIFAPVKALDFELEVGAYLRGGNELGTPITIHEAEHQIFGYSLLNDWSAKDVQWWEQVLGPFLGKSFHTSVSPWVVTSEALAPFRVPAPDRGSDAPPLLAYLDSERNRQFGGLDVDVEAWIKPREGSKVTRLVSSNLQNLSWTFAQMVAHHASNGCNLQAADLIGSGTISGEAPESRACLTEITEAGKQTVSLSEGLERTWLEDGDQITLKAYARAEGFRSIGFGECQGRVSPAISWP